MDIPPTTLNTNIYSGRAEHTLAQAARETPKTDKINKGKEPGVKELAKLNYYIERCHLHRALAFSEPFKYRFYSRDSIVIKFFEGFIQKYPNLKYKNYLKLALASLYLRRRKFEKALNLCEQVRLSSRKINPRTSWGTFHLHNITGIGYAKTEKAREKVIQNYLPIVASPCGAYDSGLYHAFLGDVFLEAGEKEKALKNYERAVKGMFPPNLTVKPELIRIVYVKSLPLFFKKIGDHFFDQRRHKKALEIYRQILRNYPDFDIYGEIQLNMGKSHLSQKNEKKALPCFNKAAKSKKASAKTQADAFTEIAGIYTKKENYILAASYFEKIINLAPFSNKTKFKLAFSIIAIVNKGIKTAKDKIKFGTILLRETETPFGKLLSMLTISLGKPNLDYSRKVASRICKEISEKNIEHQVTQRALLLREALENPRLNLKLKTIYKSKEVTIKRFEGTEGLSLVFFKDKLFPEIIPGKAKIITARSGIKIYVPKFYGKFKVVYQKPKQTVPKYNDALLKAYRISPNELFEGFKNMVFTNADSEFAGEYGGNDIAIHKSSDPLGTIIHELVHHWDLTVALGTDGKDLGFGDLSKIYYDISWTPEKIKREIWGGDYGKVKMDRHDFDKEDFAREYGLCNREEDLATMAAQYVTKASQLRKRIRKQIQEGNFELAAKYIFVRYLMPFRGREYGIKDDSLGFEEVGQKLRAWLKEHPGTVNASSIKTLNKIKEKYNEIIYK